MTSLTKSRFTMLYQFAIVSLVAFTALRTWFIYISWADLHQEGLLLLMSSFAIGVLYDLAFAFYLCAPLAVLFLLIPERFDSKRSFRVAQALIYLALLFTLFFAVAAELAFWDEFTVRFNFISVDYLIYSHEVTQNIYEYLPLEKIFLAIFLMVALLMVISGFRPLPAQQQPLHFAARGIHATFWVIGAIAFGLFLNQSLRTVYDNNFLKEIASNGPHQFFAAFRNNQLDFATFYAAGETGKSSDLIRDKVARPETQYTSEQQFDIKRTVDNPGIEKRLNVILISVESLSGEFLQRYGHELPWTPFIDEWMQDSLVFDRFYATGTRTTRGLEALTLSIPPTPGRSVVKRPDNGNMYTLGKVFNDKNYDVAYLYGGRSYFDNMGTFFSGNGYRIVDQTDFSDDEVEFSNAWGVDDESLYRKTLQQADDDYQTQQPFFFHVMTVSNHAPFTYPQDRVQVPSGTGRGGGVQYTDFAIRNFIEAAKEKPWFDDTVFVMVADHTANSAGRTGLTLSRYHIPCMIYSPKHIAAQSVDRIASQIDLAPTLLALLNFDYTSAFYGDNILSPDFKDRALIGNYQKLGLYEDQQLVILSPQKIVETIANPIAFNESLKPLPLEHINRITLGDSTVAQLTSAYYQSADWILKNRLNRW